jgi:hypothetical protein
MHVSMEAIIIVSMILATAKLWENMTHGVRALLRVVNLYGGTIPMPIIASSSTSIWSGAGAGPNVYSQGVLNRRLGREEEQKPNMPY